MMRVAFS